MNPDLFERQLATLRRRGYRPGDLETLDRLAAGDRPSGRYAFLTFDDGYLDNHATAMPLMNQEKADTSTRATSVLPPMGTL